MEPPNTAGPEPEVLERDIAFAWETFAWEGKVRWFAKDKDRRYGGWLDSGARLAQAVKVAAALGRDFYLQANPVKWTNRIKSPTADVTHWRMVVLDYDPAEGCKLWRSPQPWRTVPQTETCARVFSGRGWQYWITMPPLEVGGRAAEIERGMRNFLRTIPESPGWTLDYSCADLARVVRCPGSLNTKTNRWATMLSPGMARPIHDTILALAGPAPEPQPVPQGIESANLMEVLPHLNGSTREFLLRGKVTPGRHARCFSSVKNLHEVGVPRGAAERWALHGSATCSPPLPSGDTTRIIHQVYGG